MKRLFITAAAAAIATTPLMAQSAGGVILTNTEFEGGFSNNGQCTAALAKVRNHQRLHADARGAAYRNQTNPARRPWLFKN